MAADVRSMLYFVTFSIFLYGVLADNFLLRNGDFEKTSYTDWHCLGSCSLKPSTDAKQGQYSVEVYKRVNDWNALSQDINVTSGDIYKVTAYVKLLNTASQAAFQTAKVIERCNVAGITVYKQLGQTPLMQPGNWYQVGGVSRVSDGKSECKIYFSTPAPTDYRVDDAVMTHIPGSTWSEWMESADDRIDRVRKADLSIRLVGPNSNTTILDIELEQTRHEFRFGSAVSAEKIVDPSYRNYQDLFYRNFDWGVLENDLKWRQTEPIQGQTDYDTPVNAMNAMQARGIKMRCHCVVWGVDQWNPDWVKALTGAKLENATETRIEGVVNATKGLCEEWDVNNRVLHGQFFESNTNPNITMDMFRQVESVDNKPRLFLNDINVISGSQVTVAMKDMTVRYQEANVPIGGIGASGRMTEVDVGLVKARLDIIAEAGLPIVITEFSVNEGDVDLKEDKVTELLTLFFSHPDVDGVLFWGFWDGQIFEPNATLFNGENITANAAGRAYQDFFHNEWRTHTFQTLLGNQQYDTRVFKGSYNLKVMYDDVLLASHPFSVSDGGSSIKIRVEGNPGGGPSVSTITEA